MDGGSTEPASHMSQDDCNWGDVPEKIPKTKLSSFESSGKAPMSYSPKTMPEKTSGTLTSSDNTFLNQYYLSKLDISAELALPELYDQCISLLDVEKNASIDSDASTGFLKRYAATLSPFSVTLPYSNDSIKQCGLDSVLRFPKSKRSFEKGLTSPTRKDARTKLSSFESSGKAPMSYSPKTMPEKTSGTLTSSDNTFLSQYYLSKLDISAELALPELYDQCISLLDVEKNASIDSDASTGFLKHGSRSRQRYAATLSPFSADSSLFQLTLSNSRGLDSGLEISKNQNGHLKRDSASPTCKDASVPFQVDGGSTEPASHMSQDDCNWGDVPEKIPRTKLSSFESSGKAPMSYSPKTMPEKTSGTLTSSDNTFLSQYYLSKLDISAKLALPELYDQCISLLDVEKNASIDSDASTGFLKRAIEHYKKERVELPKWGKVDVNLATNRKQLDEPVSSSSLVNMQVAVSTDDALTNMPISTLHLNKEETLSRPAEEHLEELHQNLCQRGQDHVCAHPVN
ncbi:hypothetical protein K1719_025852 [Acacia pycnantha]|nr:hypothetical protein K1719_025852 [Acacia pycnantha]